MKHELFNCIVEPPTADAAGVIEAVFSFSEAFLGFQGHFPENPILPAVVQIQIAQVCIAQYLVDPVDLSKVVNAKFMAMVGPGIQLHVQCVPKKNNRYSCLVTDADSGDKVATYIVEFKVP